jgi:hypothetical protein
VKRRSVIAVGLTITMLAAAMPRAAHAEESASTPETSAPSAEEDAPPSIAWPSTPPPDVLRLTSDVLGARGPEMFAPRHHVILPSTGTDIRLSRGAKTAIIVGAIVVGVLIIVGVVAIGKPGKHL